MTYVFFSQAEDGIRDGHVTGVQTCALPISPGGGNQPFHTSRSVGHVRRLCGAVVRGVLGWPGPDGQVVGAGGIQPRSEERRVGKEKRGRESSRGKEKRTTRRTGEEGKRRRA